VSIKIDSLYFLVLNKGQLHREPAIHYDFDVNFISVISCMCTHWTW
jgi:hypothetical protein